MQFILAYISGIFNVQKSITVLLTSIYEENFKKAYTNEKSRDTIVFSIITGGNSMKKILMLGTGGTIACKRGESGLKPLISSEELLSYVPDAKQFCHHLWHQYLEERSYEIPGGYFSPQISVIGTGKHEVSHSL